MRWNPFHRFNPGFARACATNRIGQRRAISWPSARKSNGYGAHRRSRSAMAPRPRLGTSPSSSYHSLILQSTAQSGARQLAGRPTYRNAAGTAVSGHGTLARCRGSQKRMRGWSGRPPNKGHASPWRHRFTESTRECLLMQSILYNGLVPSLDGSARLPRRDTESGGSLFLRSNYTRIGNSRP